MNKKTFFSVIVALTFFAFFYFKGGEQARYDSLPKSVKTIIETPPIVHKKVVDQKLKLAHVPSNLKVDDIIHHDLTEEEEASLKLLVSLKEVTENPLIIQNMNSSERLRVFNRLKQMLRNPDVHWLVKRQILSQKSEYSLFENEVEKMRTLASVDARATTYAKLSDSEFIELILENAQRTEK